MKNCFNVLIAILLIIGIAFGQSNIYKLKYISPANLIEAMALKPATSRGHLFLINDDEAPAHLRLNYSNNEILIDGPQKQTSAVIDLIKFYDVPPRQIIIEVSILEVDNQKMDDLGLDWDAILRHISIRADVTYSETIDDREDIRDEEIDENDYKRRTQTSLDRSQRQLRINLGSLQLDEIINIMRENRALKVINSPRIVTTNNQTGSILDGQHVTYISRYSSYSNLYETQEINSGLSLTVTPSIGESDYLALDIEAKYTYLQGNISGSPVENGQILKNKIIARNNEPFLLGAFKRTQTITVKRKVPLLGTILPYLFSTKKGVEKSSDMLIVLTPRVIDLTGSTAPELE